MSLLTDIRGVLSGTTTTVASAPRSTAGNLAVAPIVTVTQSVPRSTPINRDPAIAALQQPGQSLTQNPPTQVGSGGVTDPGSALASGASDLTGILPGAGLFGGVSAAVTSPLDFLKFIAWIFHPRNILRAVEFLTGMALMFFGMRAAIQARGERIEGYSTSEGALTRSDLGRIATSLGGAARRGERPSRPRSAPHRTRQRALAQRYKREEDLQRRRAKAPRPTKPPAKRKK